MIYCIVGKNGAFEKRDIQETYNVMLNTSLVIMSMLILLNRVHFSFIYVILDQNMLIGMVTRTKDLFDNHRLAIMRIHTTVKMHSQQCLICKSKSQ